MRPPEDVIAEYVTRKQGKGTWAVEKPNRWKRRKVRTGICPCPECHRDQPMIVCDAEWGNCTCCDEVCS